MSDKLSNIDPLLLRNREMDQYARPDDLDLREEDQRMDDERLLAMNAEMDQYADDDPGYVNCFECGNPPAICRCGSDGPHHLDPVMTEEERRRDAEDMAMLDAEAAAHRRRSEVQEDWETDLDYLVLSRDAEDMAMLDAEAEAERNSDC